MINKLIKCKEVFLIITISLIFFILRFKKSLSSVPDIGKYDSNSYFTFSLFGGIRMPIITFIYDLIEIPTKITLFQTVASASSLLTLSLSIFLLKLNKHLIFLSSFLIVILGNSRQIIYLDSSMDSESLNITALNFLISSVIILLSVPSFVAAKIYFFICLFFFSGIKTMNNIISIFILIYLLIFQNQVLINKSKKIISYLTVILIISINLTYFTNTKITPELNTSAIINSRLWEIPKWREYVLENKFPVEARSIFIRFENRNLGEPPDAAVGDLKQYKVWFTENGGRNFLVKFMLTHPSYTIFGPVAYPFFSKRLSLNETIWRGAALGRLDYETFSSLNYKFIKTDIIFWPLDRSNAYLYLSFILLVIGICQIIRFVTNQYSFELNLITFLIFVFFSTSYFAWWFGSTPSDLGRQQFAFAYGIRIIFILSFLVMVSFLLQLFGKRKF